MTRSSIRRMRPALGVGAAMMTVWGLVYSFPLFVAPLSSELHADRAALAGMVVAVLFWGAIMGPPLGALVDRLGPRPAILAGLGLAVAGFAAFSQARELWQAYLGFSAVLGTGQALIYLGCNVLIARAFHHERATAYGIAYAALGIGTGLYAIGGQLLIDAFGWRAAALLLSATPLLVIPLVVRLDTTHPASFVAAQQPSEGLSAGRLAAGATAGATAGAFALIFFASLSLGLMDEGVYQNLLPHAVVVGFGGSQAALALAAVSVAYVVGQLVGGVAADRFGPRRTALAAFGIAALGTVGVMTVEVGGPAAFPLLVGSAMLYGGGLAVLLLVRLATFAERFAGPRFGLMTGIFALAYPIGAAGIAWFGGLSYDLWRTYLPAFGVSAAGLALATLALAVVTRVALPTTSAAVAAETMSAVSATPEA